MLIVLFITDTLALAREYYFLSSFLTFQLVCSFFFFFMFCVFDFGRTSTLPAFFVFGKAMIDVSSCAASLSNYASNNSKPFLV
jgi:hypothetical protein